MRLMHCARHLSRLFCTYRCTATVLKTVPEIRTCISACHHFLKEGNCNYIIRTNICGPHVNVNIQERYFQNCEITYASRSQGDKIMKCLELDISRQNRVNRSDVQDLLHFLQANDASQDEKVGLLLLQCCGHFLPDQTPTSRLNLTHTVWETLENLGVMFTVEHYNALLASYAANKHKVSVKEFLCNMGDVKANEGTYHYLLACVCELGDTEQAIEVISLMKAHGYPTSEATFSALILGQARARDMTNAYKALHTMSAANLTPSASTYLALLKGYAEAGDAKNMQKTFETAESSNIKMSEAHYMDIIKSLAMSDHYHLVPMVLERMSETVTELTPTTVNTIIHLVHLSHEKVAYQLLQAIPLNSELHSNNDSFTSGSFFIQEMVKANRPPNLIIEMCNLLSASGRNSRALFKAAEVALSMAQVDLAVDILRELHKHGAPLRPHYFWPLFLAASRNNGEKGIMTILKHMDELGVAADFNTLVDYILPHMSLIDEQAAVRKLQEKGLTLSQILTPFLTLLLKNSNVEAAFQLCVTYHAPIEPDKLLQPLIRVYLSTRDLTSTMQILQIMISKCPKKIDWAGHFVLELLLSKKTRITSNDIKRIMEAYVEEKINISSFAGDVISCYQKQNGTSNDVLESIIDTSLNILPSEINSQHIPHPRCMNLEELECHLLELKSKNMNTRGTLRRLLQLYCRQGNLEKATSIKKELEDAGYEFSAGMHASFFDLCIKCGHVDEAHVHMNEALRKKPNFLIDDHKILDFARLLVANNKYRGAVQLLERHALSQVVKKSNSLVRNCWKLLHTLAEKGEPQTARHMLELLVKLGFCSISNILLGPIVRAHLFQGSLMGAVKEYKRCTLEHHTTPLQHELLCHLMCEGAMQLLEEVLEATRNIHGAPNTHVALIIAMAETGKTKELHKLLLNPNLNIRHSVLLQRCKRLTDENKLTALENLSVAFKSVPNFNITPLYEFMMQVYDRRGDCDGALSLWSSMQYDDIQPSPGFLRSLASLLKSHKRDIPFVVPENGAGGFQP